LSKTNGGLWGLNLHKSARSRVYAGDEPYPGFDNFLAAMRQSRAAAPSWLRQEDPVDYIALARAREELTKECGI